MYLQVYCNRHARSISFFKELLECILPTVNQNHFSFRFITTLVYYGLSLSAGDLGVDFYVSFFISGAIEVPAYLYVMFALDKFGRKLNLCGTMVGGGSACLISLLIGMLNLHYAYIKIPPDRLRRAHKM